MQGGELQSESWSHFLEMGTAAILVKLVPVVPHEDKISLVVESNHIATMELRVLWEQRSNHPSNSITKHCIEVIENEFWVMTCGVPVIRQVPHQLNVCDSVNCCRPIRQVTVNQSMGLSVLLVENKHVCEITLLRPIYYVFYERSCH